MNGNDAHENNEGGVRVWSYPVPGSTNHRRDGRETDQQHFFCCLWGVEVLTDKVTAKDKHAESSEISGRWRENHGNVLLAFAGLILLVGSGILIYRQSRVIPPGIPEPDMNMLLQSDESFIDSDLDENKMMLIRITGAANDNGNIKIAIYESEQSFRNPDLAFATNTLDIFNGEASWSVPISSLPQSFSIAAYHDEDDDGQMNFNLFGIPTEAYGFSNNARELSGPPDFEDTLMERPEDAITLDLSLQ